MIVEFIKSITQVSEADWDSLWTTDYPFTRHAFLRAMEQSGCTTATTGWLPQHCIVMDGGHLQAAMPLFLKFHSYGEYVFDWSWADAWHQCGLSYYPKLLNAIPFTPATGPRWACREPRFASPMFSAINDLMNRDQLSGFHSLFPQASADAIFPGLQRRLGCQFHWFNRGFDSFNDFLQTFNARKRKAIKRERRKVVDQNFTIETVPGHELNTTDWLGFNKLYQRTYLKRSGHQGYLNASFFQSLGQSMPRQVMMVKAFLAGEWVAAALYLFDADTLYGRYWGATEEFDGLHFECCYYRGIEYAIANRLQRFDPGAQGEHKIQRGFTPVITQSFHQICEPRLADAVAGFLREESRHIEHYCMQAREMLPFHVETGLVDPWVLFANSEAAV